MSVCLINHGTLLPKEKTCYAVHLFVCVYVCVTGWWWRWGGGVFLVACMDRSVIQRVHTVSIVEPSVVPIGSGWGGKGASRIKTRAANRKWACKDKTRTAWLCYLWKEFGHISSFFFQIAFFLLFWFILIELFSLLGFNLCLHMSMVLKNEPSWRCNQVLTNKIIFS